MAIPIRLLYLGAAGEHYVMSECYRSNMEAFKLPIDKGFDLAVTNAYTHFKAAEDSKAQPIASPPMYLQVKSSSAKESKDQSNGNKRPRWDGQFLIKLSELTLIGQTSNSALACVAFIESVSDLSSARTAFAWWMSSSDVNAYREEGYFIESNETHYLNYVIVGEAKNSTHTQNTYVQLMRPSRSKEAAIGELASGCMIQKNCFDFSKLGTQEPSHEKP